MHKECANIWDCWIFKLERVKYRTVSFKRTSIERQDTSTKAPVCWAKNVYLKQKVKKKYIWTKGNNRSNNNIIIDFTLTSISYEDDKRRNSQRLRKDSQNESISSKKQTQHRDISENKCKSNQQRIDRNDRTRFGSK